MIPITRPELPPLEDYVALLSEIWDSRMLSNFGPMAQRLEAMTSEYLGLPTRVVVSGDIGLALTISAMQLPRGSVAIVPSFTFNSTINAVIWNGLRPVFADIDPQTFTLDPVDVRAAARGEPVSLVVATHTFGNPADAEGLAAVARDLGARLLFDAAHGYGATRDGVKVGNFGDAEVFSLSGTKPVTTAEGGLIATRDEGLLERIKLLRGYGFFGDYESKLIGLNGKMSELHAALGLLTMRRIDEALEVRDRHVEAYREALEDVPGLRFQQVRAADRSTMKDFAVVFPDAAVRVRVETALAAADVQTKRYFRPCHGMAAFKSCNRRPLPVTNAVYGRALCLPLFEALTNSSIERIALLAREAAVG